MIILGKDSADKGRQLEQLTKAILLDLGYQDVHTNTLGSGGLEIDVEAKLLRPTPGGGDYLSVICECKALKEKVDLPAWLKFLGKVYVENTKQHRQVYGSFFALSGVNGNVRSSYKDMEQLMPHIELYDGDDLLRLVTRLFEPASLENIAATLARYTQNQFRSAEIIYYDNDLYWFLDFGSSQYTLLTGKGKILTDDQSNILKRLVTLYDTSLVFVDLPKAERALKRKLRIRKIIASDLFLHGQIVLTHIAAHYPDLSLEEISDQAQHLEEEYGLSRATSGEEFSLPTMGEPAYQSTLAKLYLLILDGDVVVPDVLGCALYDQHIDDELLSHLLHMQGDLVLPNDKIPEILTLLRLTPGGLHWLLQPQPILINSFPQRKDLPDNNLITTGLAKYILNLLYDWLYYDFHTPPLKHYFFERRKATILETTRTITLSNGTEVLLQGSLDEGLGIVRVADEDGNYINLGNVIRL